MGGLGLRKNHSHGGRQMRVTFQDLGGLSLRCAALASSGRHYFIKRKQEGNS